MESLFHNWWAVALRGVVAVLFGIILLAWPGISLAFLIALWGAFALIDGIFSLVSAGRRARAHESWGTLVLIGISGVLAGLLAWFWPGITAVALTFVIGAWAIITGILAIVAAVQLRKAIRNEFWLGLSGALSVIFGILIFLNPAAGALALVWLIGLYALIFGVTLIGFGFRLRAHDQKRVARV